MSTRKLVTVRAVDAIEEIAGADAIEVAVFGGWRSVVRKGQYRPGDRAVYVEVDAALPLDDARFGFLEPRGSRTIGGARFHVLRTMKLRGVISQGLVLPLAEFPEADGAADLAATLGVVKYEAPLPAELSGTAVGPYPSVLARKTDAERVQNLAAVYPALDPDDWYATEKVDGTSTTFITTPSGLRVCGRNYEWVPSPELVSMRYAAAQGLTEAVPPGLVVQGELYGPAIQANPLDLDAVGFVAFAVWREGAQLPRSEWPRWAIDRAAPVYEGLCLPDSVNEAIAQADEVESLVAPGRRAEGIVWHRTDARPMPELDGRPCFKVISNRWLLRQASGRRRRPRR
ncbi:RNA ligase family protein [Tsukamurella sp. NPDC003166]|uniref:RNA ligase family protein n=1 Tax=Tsukamurella sp. NPDC003166 TaxID=3154444 RepID=UPI0033A29E27